MEEEESEKVSGTIEISSSAGSLEGLSVTGVYEDGLPDNKRTGHSLQREAVEEEGNVQTANTEYNQEQVNHVNSDALNKIMDDDDDSFDFDRGNEEFVASTCHEDSDGEEVWRTVHPLSPDCSQALSPLIPATGSENVGPGTRTEPGEGTSKSSSTEKIGKTHNKPSITMEFDSDSEFSGPEVNYEALNSPEADSRNRNDIVENVDEDKSDFDMEEDQRTYTDIRGKTSAERFGGSDEWEGSVMADDLPSISRKRKSQEVNGESKRRTKSEDEIDCTETEEIEISTQTTIEVCSTQSEIKEVKEENSPKMSKVRQLMQKLKGKQSARKSGEESPSPRGSAVTDSQETPGDVPATSRIQRRLLPALNTYESAQAHIQRSVLRMSWKIHLLLLLTRNCAMEKNACVFKISSFISETT
jgi:hypothetical protein